MNRATQAEIAAVCNRYWNYMIHFYNGSFNQEEFHEYMEPVFQETGYRGEYTDHMLILHDAGAGDFVLSTGAIREIRRKHPSSHITLAVSISAYELAIKCPYVNEIVLNNATLVQRDRKSMVERTVDFLIKILKYRYDICYVMQCFSYSLVVAYMTGAKERIATNFYIDEEDEQRWTSLPTVLFKDVRDLVTTVIPRGSESIHRADLNFSLVQEPIQNCNLEIWTDDESRNKVEVMFKNLTRPVYALCFGGSHKRKMYPPDKYAEAVRLILREEPTATFVILGRGKSDRDSAELFRKTLGNDERVVDLTDRTTYSASGMVLSLCDTYIGNTTGTLHLATSVKCPVLNVSSFPADIPVLPGDDLAVYYPYGVPNVSVLPAHCKLSCLSNVKHSAYGCTVVNEPHCITNIEPQTIVKGLQMLKERIKTGNIEPVRYHSRE